MSNALLSRQDTYPVWCGLCFLEAFLGRKVHLGGGSPQSPPMPDELNLPQVGPSVSCSIVHVGFTHRVDQKLDHCRYSLFCPAS